MIPTPAVAALAESILDLGGMSAAAGGMDRPRVQAALIALITRVLTEQAQSHVKQVTYNAAVRKLEEQALEIKRLRAAVARPCSSCGHQQKIIRAAGGSTA
jgi:hypothetical protein